ncbi:hypothetical protein HK102_000236 [Quaeritorhiza haematococci]|nr:hypothetical protein HK102_000236 [Quaeritorhiza haematococci]
MRRVSQKHQQPHQGKDKLKAQRSPARIESRGGRSGGDDVESSGDGGKETTSGIGRVRFAGAIGDSGGQERMEKEGAQTGFREKRLEGERSSGMGLDKNADRGENALKGSIGNGGESMQMRRLSICDDGIEAYQTIYSRAIEGLTLLNENLVKSYVRSAADERVFGSLCGDLSIDDGQKDNGEGADENKSDSEAESTDEVWMPDTSL